MAILHNPFKDLPGYHCFGCSPYNPIGLRLKFEEIGEEIVSKWEPGHDYQGYFNILHGGIQATLMDEIASWTVYVKLKTAGFTAGMEVRYLKNVALDRGPLTLRSRVQKMRRNLADIEVELYDKEEVLCSRATLTYFTFPPGKARETMFYPDHSEFYKPG